jgi:hypothetical protein
MAKQLPLVMYKRGVRTVIGKVAVNDDGSIDGQVVKDIWPAVRALFLPERGELTIGFSPKQPSSMHETARST